MRRIAFAVVALVALFLAPWAATGSPPAKRPAKPPTIKSLGVDVRTLQSQVAELQKELKALRSRVARVERPSIFDDGEKGPKDGPKTERSD